MNEYYDAVERFANRAERYAAYLAITDGRPGARANRGVQLSTGKRAALIWGLDHPSPVVRRCCLELLDQHPDPAALPHIVRRLDDPVPRVRWHAVHALICDVCKGAALDLDADVVARIRAIAATDPSGKVRAQATYGLQLHGLRPSEVVSRSAQPEAT